MQMRTAMFRDRAAFAAVGIVIGVGLVAVSSTGCGGKSLAEAYNTRDYDHEYKLAPGDEFRPDMQTAIVLPMNALVERPTGLDVADAALMGMIVGQLEERGVEVTRIGDAEFDRGQSRAASAARKRMMSGTTGTVSTEVSSEQFMAELLPALEREADLIVVPGVVMRTGSYSGGKSVRWDGVKRRERIRGGGRMTGGGSLPVASMVVMVHGRQRASLVHRIWRARSDLGGQPTPGALRSAGGPLRGRRESRRGCLHRLPPVLRNGRRLLSTLARAPGVDP